MEEDFLPWNHIGDNILEHVITEKVKDKFLDWKVMVVQERVTVDR